MYVFINISIDLLIANHIFGVQLHLIRSMIKQEQEVYDY